MANHTRQELLDPLYNTDIQVSQFCYLATQAATLLLANHAILFVKMVYRRNTNASSAQSSYECSEVRNT